MTETPSEVPQTEEEETKKKIKKEKEGHGKTSEHDLSAHCKGVSKHCY